MRRFQAEQVEEPELDAAADDVARRGGDSDDAFRRPERWWGITRLVGRTR
ncbi:hypothetical protein [Streptomyces sp. NPDC058861]